MKSFIKNEQSGRSMVEMLGVLAIIGVLSVGGIAGYSKAMAKYKVSKTTDQISMLVSNIRTLFAGQRDYTGLTTTVAGELGVAPSEMIDDVSSARTLTNAFDGGVFIEATAANPRVFGLAYSAIPRDACVTLLTSDWGGGSSSGLVGIVAGSGVYAATNVSGQAAIANTANTRNPGNGIFGSSNIPVSPVTAATICNTDTNNFVAFFYN